jgi:hypothetical protein
MTQQTQSQTLNESLQYLDMEHQLIAVLGIDKYSSKIGNDSDFITLDFTVKSSEAAEDLVIWLERGYSFIIDAETSPGEVSDGKFLVFAEINRRSKAPNRIMEMLDDLQTLTGIDSSDWDLEIGDKTLPATEENIRDNVSTSPHEYRESHETELNEMRDLAGLDTVNIYTDKHDDVIQQMQLRAGII